VTRFGWDVPTGEDVPLGVDDVFNLRWSYGASKLHGEIAIIAAAASYGMPYTIIRYHNAYGPRMGDKHVVPDFFNRARRGVFELHGYQDTRSFIYVEDAVRATITLSETGEAASQIVNVGGDEEIRIEDLGRLMMEAAGLVGEITLKPSPAGSVFRRAPKLEKLKRLTGYCPRVSLREGLRETAKFYLD
jgi:nucleoside-diphosphate-sugar epimerase